MSRSKSTNNLKQIKKRELLEMLQGFNVERGIELLVSRMKEPCSKFDEEICMDYLDFTLGEREKEEFEAHFSDCPSCLFNLFKTIEADEKISRDPLLGESFRQKSITSVLARLGIGRAEIPEEDEPLLLAASPEIKFLEDTASGIGVSPETDRGVIIECIAHVFKAKGQEGHLHVFGSQVEEKEIEGKRIKITPPLEMIQQVLSTLFRSQTFFNTHQCAFRDITIQVSQEQEGYLTEGLSLSLAAAVAVYLAITGRSLAKEVVFSGNLEITGRLRRVGHLGLKLRVAQKSGKKVVILPEENRKDVKRLSQEEVSNLTFQFFDSLDQVFHYLEEITSIRSGIPQRKASDRGDTVQEEGTPTVNSVTPAKIIIDARQYITVKGSNLKRDLRLEARGVQFKLKKSSPGSLVFKVITDENTQEGTTNAAILWQGREIYSFELECAYGHYVDTLFRFDRYPIRASINIGFYLVFLFSGGYFFLTDFLLALALKPLLPIRFYDILHVLSLSLIMGNLIFGFIKDRGHKPIRSVLFYLMFFLLVSLSLFVTAPYRNDDVDLYNRTSHYINNPRFEQWFSDVPNFPVLHFKKYQEKGDVAEAFNASRRVVDLKDYIRNVYIPLTGLFEAHEYQNRQAAIESTNRFLQGVNQYYTDPTLRRKILRGLQAATWLAETLGDEDLMKKIKQAKGLISNNEREGEFSDI